MISKILQSIVDFFSSLFGGGRSGGQPETPDVPEVPDIPEVAEAPDVSLSDTEDVDDSEEGPVAQDAADVYTEGGELILEESEAKVDTDERSSEVAETTGNQRYLWCLDNGHGNQTAGKRSPVLEDGRQLLEYRFNREIVRRIIEKLESLNVAYFNVVPEEDIGDFLAGRVNRANNKSSALPRIYVSIHANAAPTSPGKEWASDSIRGIETWYFSKSASGKRIAAIFQRHLIEFTGFKNRRLKTKKSGTEFFVLRKTTMPAILTENGFYNNRLEVVELLKDEVQQQIADAHVAAILEIEANGY